MVCLVFYAMALHAHRTAPENANLPADGSPVKDEEKGHVQHEMGAVPVPVYVQEQQPQYPQATQQQYPPQ